MRARALAAAVAGSAAVLGLAVGIGHGQEAMTTAPIPLPEAAVADGAPTAVPIGHRGAGEQRYTGELVQTRYGPMQVRIAVRAGRLVRVWALRLTDRYGRSVRASTAAAPVLERRSIAAGSADIAGVTGATYTSEGYRRSLQSALDEAAG